MAHMTTEDMLDIICQYAADYRLKPSDFVKHTFLSLPTVTRVLTRTGGKPRARSLTAMMEFIERKAKPAPKTHTCCGTGCDAMRLSLEQKQRLVEELEAVIQLQRQKIQLLTKK